MAGIAVFAVLAFVRIGFTTATVSTMISSQAVAAQISETTSANASLSVQKSVLGSPSAVKERAGALGMAEAAGVETIALAPDVVAYDGAGNLSLSASLSHAA
jgi:cell division protein FtsL